MSNIARELSNRFANMGFVCALLVVAIHTAPAEIPSDGLWFFKYLLFRGVAVIGVPFFFLASGIFLGVHCHEDGWWRRACRKRVFTLLIPFVFWCSFLVIVGKVLIPLGVYFVKGSSPAFGEGEIIKWGTYGLDFFSGPILGPLWFVRTLFFYVLFSPVIKYCLQKSAVCTLIVLGVAYYVLDPVHDQIRYFSIDKEWRSFLGWYLSLEGLFYFSAGLSISLFDKFHYLDLKKPWLAAVGLFICFFPLLFGFERLRVAPLSIPFVLLGVWSFCPNNRVFVFSGLAFPVYILHGLIKYGLCMLPASLKGLTWWFAVEWVIMVTVSILVALAIRKCSSPFSNFVFGNRNH